MERCHSWVQTTATAMNGDILSPSTDKISPKRVKSSASIVLPTIHRRRQPQPQCPRAFQQKLSYISTNLFICLYIGVCLCASTLCGFVVSACFVLWLCPCSPQVLLWDSFHAASILAWHPDCPLPRIVSNTTDSTENTTVVLPCLRIESRILISRSPYEPQPTGQHDCRRPQEGHT